MKELRMKVRNCLECPWKRYADIERTIKGCGYKGGLTIMDSWDGIPTWCELPDVQMPIEDIVEPGC